MTLQDIDTSRLLFDVKSPTFVKDIKDKIQEFNTYEGKIPEKKVFAFVVLLYDPSSPLWRLVLDYYERKRIVAELVDFPKKKGKWSDEAEKILTGEDEKVNAMLVEFAWQFATPELLQLIANMSLLSSETRKAVSFKGNKDTIKIITETGDEIRRLTRVVFHSGDYDELTAVRNALYAKAEKERVKIKPEDVVRVISETGGLPEDFNPYGEGYRPKKSIFIGDEAPEE